MDIVVWLRSLGLGKYEAIFRENDIDEAVLPSLTHENLKELGVTSVWTPSEVAGCHRCSAQRRERQPPSSDPKTTSSAPAPLPKTAPSAAKSR